MATVLELAERGLLLKLDPVLGPRDQEWRFIYLLPRLSTWIRDALPELESTWKIEESPAEQLDAFVEFFCAGKPLAFGQQFKPVSHIRDGVWELKTADLRVFGWFCEQDCFIGSSADLTDRIKKIGLYGGYRDEAVQRRNGLDLDEPKFVPGDDPHGVVTDFYFPL